MIHIHNIGLSDFDSHMLLYHKSIIDFTVRTWIKGGIVGFLEENPESPIAIFECHNGLRFKI